jgi:predicted Zn-dependent protease
MRTPLTIAVLLALAGASTGRVLLHGSGTATPPLRFTEAEDRQLGAIVSARLRERYGVVQDPDIHRYVTLVGTLVARSSSLSYLDWRFVVLDTDGVNVFSTPGGFVHVTRGALALMCSEGELAGVLAHEIGHLMARHTLVPVERTRTRSASRTESSDAALLEDAARVYAITVENAFARDDEMVADKIAIALANDAGYNPSGLAAFLARLAARNRSLAGRSGLFASHAETRTRIDRLRTMVKTFQLTNTADRGERYAASIPFARTGVSDVLAAGGENPDRDASGGPNAAPVVVSVSPGEVDDFGESGERSR